MPKDAKEERETALLLSLLAKEKNQIEAPREILQKILKNHNFSQEVSGRSSWRDKLNNLINLIFMEQKMKLPLSIFGIALIIVAVIVTFKATNPEMAKKENGAAITKTRLATTTPVIGDEKIDASINSSLDEILNENDFDSELDDIELALSDERALDDINNLIKDDEL